MYTLTVIHPGEPKASESDTVPANASTFACAEQRRRSPPLLCNRNSAAVEPHAGTRVADSVPVPIPSYARIDPTRTDRTARFGIDT